MWRHFLCGLLSLLAAGTAAAQQEFPARPVTIVVAGAPGLPIDIISRTETQLLDLLVDSAPEEIAKSVHASTELQGPQTPENALKQGEVDDLLSSLGF